MNTRTQIYLDDRQRRALKLLSASTDQSVSDLVRRAVDRLLAGEFANKDWATQVDALAARVRAHASPKSVDKIAEAVRRARRKGSTAPA